MNPEQWGEDKALAWLDRNFGKVMVGCIGAVVISFILIVIALIHFLGKVW